MTKILVDKAVLEQALEALNATMATHGKREWIENAKQQANAALRSALEHPDIGNPVSLPAGWKLVPVEPTNEMVQAWLDTYEGNIQTVYRAMLATAPKPPVVEQPQGEQEPVGEAGSMPGTDGFTMACFRASDVPVRTKLYTHSQPPRQPLTDERIYKMGLEHKRIAKDGTEWFDRESFARAIERAHGIGGEA